MVVVLSGKAMLDYLPEDHHEGIRQILVVTWSFANLLAEVVKSDCHDLGVLIA